MKVLYLILIFGVVLSYSAGTHIRIKNNKIITDSSKVLYAATRHRAYFRKVFFLIPSMWSSGLADRGSSSVNLREADIILSDPSSVSRRSYPRTRSYAGCGNSGIHIQLRTDVLFNNNHPLVQGKPDPDTGEFPEGCAYYPYPTHNHGTASMMDHSYIQEIKDFCDDDQTPGHFSHNMEPPNRQNRLCSHRSTWDVISNTPDFLNNANPPGSLSDSQLAPQFSVFRAPSRR